MNLISSFDLDFKEDNETYYKLLKEEDFDFKTKNINISIDKTSKDNIKVEIMCDSVIDLKIANSALIKSLEVINKTLKV